MSYRIFVEAYGKKELFYIVNRKEDVHKRVHDCRRAFKGRNINVTVVDDNGKTLKKK